MPSWIYPTLYAVFFVSAVVGAIADEVVKSPNVAKGALVVMILTVGILSAVLLIHGATRLYQAARRRLR